MAWAHVTDSEAHSKAQDKPPPRQVWKPKLNNPVNWVPSQPGPSTTPESPLDSSKAPQTSQDQVEMPLTSSPIVAAPSQAMTKELSITDQWALQLRDGRHVAVPSSGLVAPLSSNPFYALSPEFTDFIRPPSPVLGESFPCKYGAVGTELALEVQPVDNPLTFTWEDEAMWVEPLAILAPMEEDVAGLQPDSDPKSSQTHRGMPSV